ncbi:MAG: DUF402 domain-containing protein [Rhodococcus sp. (in: high G+C Gram-positive bacteria)]|uniref:DUF402 domain-containing protein n=1 Tax=Rhodococcus sp. TaxID=1831 RepID=UPI002ADCB189|nr:DUF402 domain-containing protein [Rhodococcus sp. (in: high G+C Gram-positive bacteria)]
MSEERPHIHRPKVETFDIAARTNVDPKGFIRPVEQYREEPWGLYMARHADHPRFHYLESWIIPELGIRASILHFTPEHVRDWDYYVDIGDFTRSEQVWTSEDHYLDLIVQTGHSIELLDVDELLEANTAGILDPKTSERAMLNAARAIDGIAAHGHNLDAWLGSLGMPVTWR